MKMENLNRKTEYQKIEAAVREAVTGLDFREDAEYFNADAHISVPALVIIASASADEGMAYRAEVRRINPDRPGIRNWWEVAAPPWEASTPEQSVELFMTHLPDIQEQAFETAEIVHGSMQKSFERGLEAEKRLSQAQ